MRRKTPPVAKDHKPAGLAAAYHDRHKIPARFGGTCTACQAGFATGDWITPVIALHNKTLWVHWQPDLVCYKQGNDLITRRLQAEAQVTRLPKQQPKRRKAYLR